MALRTDDPVEIVGYCPRYLSRDFLDLLTKYDTNDVKVTVERVNPQALLHLRLLCKIVASWPKNFIPCSEEKYEPIVDSLEKEIQNASKTLVGKHKSLTIQSNGDLESVPSHNNTSGNLKSQTVRSITSSEDEYNKGGKQS